MAERRCCCCGRKAGAVILVITGSILLIAGLLLSVGGMFSKIINYEIDKNLVLKPGTLVFEQWEKATIPIYQQFYIFNLTNPEAVFNGTDIPHLQQKGPYSYREIRSNKLLNWTDDKSGVIFMPNRSYIFDPETSCSTCNDSTDMFSTVNIPLMALVDFVKSKWKTFSTTKIPILDMTCYEFLKIEIQTNYMLFHSRSVREILWGYNDTLLSYLQDLSPAKLCPTPKGLNPWIQLQKNNTYYGISGMNTGEKNINLLEQFTMWRNEKNLSWWSDKYANMINGTDGTQFKPRITKKDKLYVFVPELCRSIYMVYDSTITVRGIDLYRFTAPEEMYLSGDIYPPNKGFCVPRRHPHCLPTGLLNISLCQPMNPPIVMSPPHFYHSNKSLLKNVTGLHPNKEEHATFVDIEPHTGITMQANKRLQINVFVEPSDLFLQTNGSFEHVYLPIVYVNESAQIDKDLAETFKNKVMIPIFISQIIQWALVALGGLLLLIALILFVTIASKGSKDRELRIKVEDDRQQPSVSNQRPQNLDASLRVEEELFNGGDNPVDEKTELIERNQRKRYKKYS